MTTTTLGTSTLLTMTSETGIFLILYGALFLMLFLWVMYFFWPIKK